MPTTGTAEVPTIRSAGPRLIVLRGNSGSGKTTTALAMRARCPGRFAWIEQDHLRRVVLQEDGDAVKAATSGLIEQVVRCTMSLGMDVILEGILDAQRYGSMLEALHESYSDSSAFYSFSVPLEETLLRHKTRAVAAAFGPDELRTWYREDDRLGFVVERSISALASLDETVDRLLNEADGDV